MDRMRGYQAVSMAELISTPERYHNKVIRVIGYLCCGPGEAYLFLSKDSSDYSDTASSVLIRIQQDNVSYEYKQIKTEQLWDKINGRYIDVIGLFDMYSGRFDLGNKGSFTEIKNIDLATRWYDGKKWLNKKLLH